VYETKGDVQENMNRGVTHPYTITNYILYKKSLLSAKHPILPQFKTHLMVWDGIKPSTYSLDGFNLPEVVILESARWISADSKIWDLSVRP
jgi:hypothetical protein